MHMVGEATTDVFPLLSHACMHPLSIEAALFFCVTEYAQDFEIFEYFLSIHL